MPEIAEVKLISDNISRLINGKKIISIEVLTAGYKGIKGLSELTAKLPLIVTNVRTKGKFSWLELNDGTAIGYGLGMSGNVRIEPTAEYLAEYNHRQGTQETAAQYLKHAHLKIHYECPDGARQHFYYHDIRRFGRWEYLTKPQLISKLNKLGSDLIQETLSDAEVVRLFRCNNHGNICKVLMDQHTIAGVGAYIKSEILYSCKIHPLAVIKDIPDAEIIKLYKAAKNIAIRAYTAGGASLYTFTGMNGDKSDFKSELSVYGKNEDPVGNKVVRIPDNESPDKRTTHWVPVIQIIGVKSPLPRGKITIKFKLSQSET